MSLTPTLSSAEGGAALSPVAPGLDPEPPRPVARHLFNRFCARLSKGSLVLAVIGLIGIIVCVQTQVVGRYVFNDTPTWTEALSLQLVLYVTSLGVAVGVRDAGHIGLDSLVSLLPTAWRLKVEILIHLLVALFGAVMAWSGWNWTVLKWGELDPMLQLPVGLDYLSLVVAGVLIVLFSFEHVLALLRGEDIAPAWH